MNNASREAVGATGGADLLGAVLCGGASSRMGSDKAALPHPDGGTFLDHAVCRLRPVTGRAVIAGRAAVPRSLRRAGDAWFASLEALPDPSAHQGPLTGVITALCHARAHGMSGVLVTPVDMPRLSTCDLHKLVATFGGETQIPVVATFDPPAADRPGESGRAEPLVAIYPLVVLDSLEQLALSPHRGLSRWLARRQYSLCRLPSASAANINYPSELVQ